MIPPDLKKNIALALVILFACDVHSQVSFQTKQFKLSFNQSGKLIEMLDRSTNKNYLPPVETSFLLNVKRHGNIVNPNGLQWKIKSSPNSHYQSAGRTYITCKSETQPVFVLRWVIGKVV